LLEPVAVDWTLPSQAVEAIVFTSPQAPRLAGAQAGAYRQHPVLTVGERTAQAAREAGFADVRAIGSDASGLFAAVRRAGIGHVLHLAGADRTQVDHHGVEVTVRTVYAANPVACLMPEAERACRSGAVDWVLLFSTRTAAHFASLFDRAGLARSSLNLAAISTAARDAAGPGWRQAIAAAAPDQAHLLAAAGLSCDKPDGMNGQER
jgi:uroporphyrinogen-III synthase